MKITIDHWDRFNVNAMFCFSRHWLGMSIIDIFAPYRDTDISAETYRFSMSMRYILNNEKTRKWPYWVVWTRTCKQFISVDQSANHAPDTDIIY